MSLIVRKAERSDCKEMMQLINELAVYEKAPEEVTVDFEHFVESGFGNKPVWKAFVATSSTRPHPDPLQKEREDISRVEHAKNEVKGEDEIVGFALYYIRYSTWKGQRLYLEDLIVTENMRGQGIGKLLFDRLIEECKEKQFNGMVWQVLDWNEPAINFYKKYEGVNIENGWLNCSLNFKKSNSKL